MGNFNVIEKREKGKMFLKFSGKIDEDAKIEHIFENLNGIDEIEIDLQEVEMINSYGVRLWILTFSKIPDNIKVVLKNVPELIINQVNMISNFLPENACIKSFYAPFYCENCDKEERVLFEIDNIDVNNPLSQEYRCKSCGGILDFDELEDEYFAFLESRKCEDLQKTQKGKNKILFLIEYEKELFNVLFDYLKKENYQLTIYNLKSTSIRSEYSNLIEENDLVVCGYKDLDKSLELVKSIRNKYGKDKKLVVFTEESIVDVVTEHWVDIFYPDNIVAFSVEKLTNNEDLNMLKEELKNIKVVFYKLLTDDIFGIDKYLDNPELTPKNIVIRDSAEKSKYIEEVINYAKENGIRRKLLKDIEIILDELIMNAIYDAPVDENGKKKYVHYDRKVRVILEENEYADLYYIKDDDGKFIVSVVDYFGSLTKEQIFEYLKNFFSETTHSVSFDEGGAGIGFYMVYNYVHKFVVNIEKGKKTEIIAILYNVKMKRSKDKVFHIFTKE